MVRAKGCGLLQAFSAQRIFLPSAAFAAPTASTKILSPFASGLSLHHLPLSGDLGAARLVPTLSRPSGSGLGAGSLKERFPRIWPVLHRGFPGEHSSFLSSPLCLSLRHAWRFFYRIGMDKCSADHLRLSDPAFVYAITRHFAPSELRPRTA